jgi:hypothetical protein
MREGLAGLLWATAPSSVAIEEADGALVNRRDF